MKSKVALACCVTAIHAANIVMSNDDGWAEINVRTFYDTITAAGNSAFISSPAENESGTGENPRKLFTSPSDLIAW